MASYSSEPDVEKGSGKEIYSVDEAVSKPFRTQSVVANPAPLGLMAFALTNFVLSCQNAGLFVSESAPQTIVTGLALSYGGLAQLLAGMWEFSAGNTFGATVFTSYGCFWLSFAVIQIPAFGVRAAFQASGSVDEFHTALGIWLLGWTIFTFVVCLATLRTNVCLNSLFVSSFITLIFLTVGEFEENRRATRAGGMAGIFTAFIAWYLALANMVNKQNSFFDLPIGRLSSARPGLSRENSKESPVVSSQPSPRTNRVLPFRSRSELVTE